MNCIFLISYHSRKQLCSKINRCKHIVLLALLIVRIIFLWRNFWLFYPFLLSRWRHLSPSSACHTCCSLKTHTSINIGISTVVIGNSCCCWTTGSLWQNFLLGLFLFRLWTPLKLLRFSSQPFLWLLSLAIDVCSFFKRFVYNDIICLFVVRFDLSNMTTDI